MESADVFVCLFASVLDGSAGYFYSTVLCLFVISVSGFSWRWTRIGRNCRCLFRGGSGGFICVMGCMCMLA